MLKLSCKRIGFFDRCLIYSERKEKMKKNLALLLVVAMALTAMIGLVPASAAESTTPSQEIEYFNVSLRVGATLLFAVPADGYSVQADGTVKNLKLVVVKDSVNPSTATPYEGELLEASGKTEINEKEYIVFEYSGLAANEMCDIVYARTVTLNDRGFRTYGDIKSFSLTEFVQNYNGQYKALVGSMLAYGDAAIAYKANESVKANFKPSESSSSLYTIKVKRVVDGTPLDAGYDFVQYAKAGSVTLAVPPIADATFVSFSGADVADGKITVSGNVELTANYTTKNGTLRSTIAKYLTDYEVGTHKASDGSSASKTFDNNVAIGNDWSTANNRNKFEYSSFELCEENGVKYIKYAHNGAGEFKIDASWKGTGIADILDFTFEISVKAGPNGTFPTTSFRVDRQGKIDGSEGGDSPCLIRLDDNGDIVLGGADYTDVVIGKGDSTKFQTITVVYDASEGTFTGYVDGVEKATTNATITPDYLFATLDGGSNGRARISIYGGYNGGNWVSVDGYPTALIEAGVFTVTEAEGTNTVKDINTGLYRNIDPKNEAEAKLYEGAQRYSVKYNDAETSRPAIAEYILANQYVCISSATLTIGNTMSK